MPRLHFGTLAKVVSLVILVGTLVKCYIGLTLLFSSKLRPLYLEPSPSNHSPLSQDDQDLHWFVQVTDLHVSKFHDPQRMEDFRQFCHFLSSSVSPLSVLVTGDITDAKEKNFHGSRQFLEEWDAYLQVVQGCKENTKWLDIRGNHDTFDVASPRSERNYFKDHSVQGPYHSRSYMETVESNGKSIGFVGIDATPSPGLKRPFNFFGVITQEDLGQVEAFLEKTKENDYSVIFGHYPTSSVSTFGGRNLRQLLSGQVYLCGHFHTVFGYETQMYTRHATGLLELELGDWKDYRRYRILAFDQGMLSFVDQTFHPDKPNVGIIVTNPKAPEFFLESESFAQIGRSDAVRVLVFSDRPIQSVQLLLPGAKEKIPMKQLSERQPRSPLYTAGWNPSKYGYGLRKLVITVTLRDGTVIEEEHWFSLDGTQRPYGFLARLILMMDWLPFSADVFGFITFFIVVGLSSLRIIHFSNLSEVRLSKVKSSSPRWLRKLWVLSSVTPLYKMIIASMVYLSFFPWAIGYVLNDRLGLICVWGILLIDDLTYAPPDMTFLLAIMSYILNVLPLLWIVAKAADKAFIRTNRNQEEESKRAIGLALLWKHFGFCAVLSIALYSTWSFSCMYGVVSILSPWGIGRVVMNVQLYLKASSLKASDFHGLQYVWDINRE